MKRLILICLLSVPLALMAQIKLKRFEENGKQGYKSIVFEKVVGKNADGSDRKEQVEYDIQANNPFNKLSLSVDEIKPDGQKVYKVSSLKSINPNSKTLYDYKDIKIYSHYFIHTSGDHAVVAYNLNPTSEGETISDERKSEIVLIKNGKEVSRVKLNSDAFGVKISPNGRFIGFQINEVTEHSDLSEKPGFIIYDTHIQSNFFERSIDTNTVTNRYDLLTVSVSLGNRRRGLYVLNSLTGKLYFRDFGDSGYAKHVLDNNTVKQGEHTYKIDRDFQIVK